MKERNQKILSSLISIVIGLAVGGVLVLVVGLLNSKIGIKGAWEGVRIIFAGILSTGRDAAGNLTWGFNSSNLGNMLFRATPLIMTGLSVAVAYQTGLFNIGAPGQYLMGTMASLMIALSIPTSVVPAWIVWFLASRRHARRCDLGSGTRDVQGAAEYQRSPCMYHDKLDRCKPGHLDV